MTDVLEMQGQNNEDVDSTRSEEEGERKALDPEQTVTRSGCVAPSRLIEEMGILSEEVEANSSWKECSMC
jgi:hypothetical protein